MKIIKYILHCVIGVLDAMVGNAPHHSWKETFTGLLAVAVALLIFFGLFVLLDKKTNFNYYIKIVCAILLTTLILLIIFGIIIIFEKLFY